MRLHFLGICGTFMGNLALLARALGHEVTGCDANVYPPMSTLLAEQGINIIEGYGPDQLDAAIDCVIVGNAMKRGMPVIESLLQSRLPFTSGPAWLGQAVCREQHVLCVTGTHGKTTTSSLLAWILETAGLAPGFLVGGALQNFSCNARLGGGQYFVIEGDEYDTAFFDKRSKFLHYYPNTVIMNNCEFDHADIFSDLDAIQTQFHHMLKIVPQDGTLIVNAEDQNCASIIARGCWSKQRHFGLSAGEYQAKLEKADGSAFQLLYQGDVIERVHWDLFGLHNVQNALAAIAAAHSVGVSFADAARALAQFKNTKRRGEVIYEDEQVVLYDDFAHHPTAIAATLQGLRAKVGSEQIISIVEFRSNTMRAGVHRDSMGDALKQSDQVVFLRPDPDWGIDAVCETMAQAAVFDEVSEIMAYILSAISAATRSHILIMSNGSFDALRERLTKELKTREYKLVTE